VDNGQVTTIPGHAVAEITVIGDNGSKAPDFDTLFRINHQTLVPEELTLRKDELIKWLKKNRLPVVDFDEKLNVANTVDILPPYNANSCVSSNEVVLTRIQKLVNNLPTR